MNVGVALVVLAAVSFVGSVLAIVSILPPEFDDAPAETQDDFTLAMRAGRDRMERMGR